MEKSVQTLHKVAKDGEKVSKRIKVSKDGKAGNLFLINVGENGEQ